MALAVVGVQTTQTLLRRLLAVLLPPLVKVAQAAMGAGKVVAMLAAVAAALVQWVAQFHPLLPVTVALVRQAVSPVPRSLMAGVEVAVVAVVAVQFRVQGAAEGSPAP